MSVTNSNSSESIKASTLEKDISKFNEDKQDKGKDRTEEPSNVETIEFGNIEINIDDDVLELYA